MKRDTRVLERGLGSVGEEKTIHDAARSVGLDPDAAVAAGRNEALRAELESLVQRNYDERDVFGVPMFILPDDQRFWGHDRMEWGIRNGYVRAAD